MYLVPILSDNKNLVSLLYFAQNQYLHYMKYLQLVPLSKFNEEIVTDLDGWTNCKYFI